MKDSITEDQASVMITVKASLYEQFLENKVWENERKSKKVKEREREREKEREKMRENFYSILENAFILYICAH